jgi:hypothetical protein
LGSQDTSTEFQPVSKFGREVLGDCPALAFGLFAKRLGEPIVVKIRGPEVRDHVEAVADNHGVAGEFPEAAFVRAVRNKV